MQRMLIKIQSKQRIARKTREQSLMCNYNTQTSCLQYAKPKIHIASKPHP